MKNIIIQLLILFSTISGFACSCREKSSVKKALKEADIVVSGKVISQNFIQTPGTNYAFAEYLIVVSEVFKGKLKTDTIKIKTGLGGGDCGYNFKVGKIYIVYSYFTKSGEFFTNICTRTKEFEEMEFKKIKKLARRKGYS